MRSLGTPVLFYFARVLGQQKMIDGFFGTR